MTRPVGAARRRRRDSFYKGEQMKFSEGKIGRVFVVRFDDGEEIPAAIEKFAGEHGIAIGYVNFTGGLTGGEIFAGSELPYARPFAPCKVPINEARFASAIGLIAPDEQHAPRVEIGGALGFQDKTLAGSLARNLKTWNGGEAIIYEVIGADLSRAYNAGVAELTLNAGAAARTVTLPAPSEHLGDHTHIITLFNAVFE
jgi:predicted DNA-binding protein with PD1-like motif